MIKIEKGYVASHRSTLRFRAVEEIRQEGVWEGIDSQEINRIVEVLDDTPDELYSALKEARRSGRLCRKFQRLAIKTQPQQSLYMQDQSDNQVTFLRRRISQKKRQYERQRQQLAGSKFRSLVNPLFPIGFTIRDFPSVEDVTRAKLGLARKRLPPLRS